MNKKKYNGNIMDEDDKMKNIIKIILPCLFLFFLIGCNLNNTPTSKVEEKLSNYQMLDKKINDDIDAGVQLLASYDQDNNIKNSTYKKLVTKQYKNIVYEVKEEVIDGDNATITVEIEVLDYRKITDDNINDTLLKQLENTKEKVTYSIDFYVIKDNDGNWNLSEIDDITLSKILGLY